MKIKRIIAALIALAALFTFNACRNASGTDTENDAAGAKADLKDCVKISFSGFDTVGTAQVSFDCRTFVKNNRTAFGIAAMAGSADIDAAAAGLDSLLSGSLDKTDGLSNGETVGFKWESGDALTEKLDEKYGKGRLAASDFSVTVKGLTPLTDYSPENGCTVFFEGIDGEGTAVVRFEASLPDEARKCSLSKSDGLKNGDKITLTFDESVGAYYISRGRRVTAFSFEHTVSGLARYITKTEMMNKSELGIFEPEIEDGLKTYAESRLKSGVTIGIKELYGTLLFVRTDGAGENAPVGDSVNRLYAVYRVSVSDGGDTAEFFIAPYVDNVACTPEGELPGSVSYHPVLPLGEDDPDFESQFGTLKGFGSLEKLWETLCADTESQTHDSSFEPPEITPVQTQENQNSAG